MRNAVGAPKVVDVETVAVEIADEDAIAVRVARRGADVDVLEQIDATHRLIGRDRPDCFGGVRHVFDLGDQRLLVGESLVERARHRILADHEPAGLDFVVARELLVVFSVPAILLRVEVGGVEIADVQKRHTRGRAGDQHHVVLENFAFCVHLGTKKWSGNFFKSPDHKRSIIAQNL